MSRDVSLNHGNRRTGCDGGRGESRTEPSRETRQSTLIEMGTSHTQPLTQPSPRVPLSHDLCQPFAYEQFHALLNSLFKVLFNFPSRYLFAIGLVGIFSLGWSIPPVLSCTHKQLDSGETPAWQSPPPHGPVTLYGKGPRSNGLGRRRCDQKMGFPHTTSLATTEMEDSVLG